MSIKEMREEWNFVDDRGRECIAVAVLMTRGLDKISAEKIASDLYWKIGTIDDLIAIAENYKDR